MSGPTLPGGLWSTDRDGAGNRALYDAWAERYDADMAAGGMLGPRRVAEMLMRVAPDRDVPILDFGCGTGLCGAELARRGYTDIAGSDVSAAMIDKARETGSYARLDVTDPEAPAAVAPGTRVVTACGSICVGAAPAPVLGQVARAMEPGAWLVLTLNDDTIRDRDHVTALAELQIDGVLRPGLSEYGPQLPALGRGAVVAALERL